MAKQSLAFVALALTLLLCFSGCTESLVVGRALVVGREVTKQWCVVMPSASAAQLDNNIQLCCSAPKVDCKAIQTGGMCYNCRTNKASDASVVMNLYFQVAGKKYPSCYFNGSGLIVIRDPSVGNCKFQA